MILPNSSLARRFISKHTYTTLQIPIEARLPHLASPFLAPDHECDDREERREQDSSEGEPCPEVADRGGERECKITDDEGEAAREVEQDA